MHCTIKTIVMLSFCLMFFGTNIFAQTHNASKPNDSYYQYIGRVDLTDTNGTGLYYAGTLINCKFMGTSVKAKFSDSTYTHGGNRVGYSIDNGPLKATTLTNGGKNQMVTIATGLTDTIHSLVICKLTGVECGCLVFQGLTLDSLKTLAAPPAMPDLHMECYGTSIAAGVYASCVDTNNCVSNQSKDNGYIAFPSVLARRLNAAMFNNGISGLGLVTNYGYFGTGLDTTWNKLCPNTSSGEKKTIWNFSRFTPKIVIMAMGINDQTTWPSSGTTRTTAINNFIATYMKITKNLDSMYAHPAFLFCVDPMGGTTGDSYTASKKVADSLRKMGLKTWYYKYTASYGWYHPDSAQSATMGNELATYITAQHIIDSVSTNIKGSGKVTSVNSTPELRISGSAGVCRLIMRTSTAGRLAVGIFDVMGRKIFSLDQWYNSGNHVITLPQRLTKSMLIVEVRSNTGIVTRTVLPIK